MTVYTLVTPGRVRAYGSYARAFALYVRAERLGIDVEFVPVEVKPGCTKRQRALAAEAQPKCHTRDAFHSCNARAELQCDLAAGREEHRVLARGT